jgi:DNA polymerase elongation subunit (family B)
MRLNKLPVKEQANYDSDSLIYISDDEFQYNKDFDKKIIREIKDRNLQIYSGYYEYSKGDKTPKIYISGRGNKIGKFKIKIEGFRPYCYAECEKGEYRTYLNVPVEKYLFETHPTFIARFRDRQVKMGMPMPYEADILYVRRFLCDVYDYFKPKKAIAPVTAIFDVETDYPMSEEIISYAFNNQKGDIKYNSRSYVSNLHELAIDLYEEITKVDVVTGWNVSFDVEQLEKMLVKVDRLLNHARKKSGYSKELYIKTYEKIKGLFGLDSRVLIEKLFDYNYLKIENNEVVLGDRKFHTKVSKVCSVVDLLSISRKMYGREIKGRWDLGNVGRQICGLDKKHTGAKHIRDLDEETLMEYNVLDTIVPEIIDNTLGGLRGHLILAWSLQVTLEDVMITAAVNDIALIRAYHRAGIVLPSRDYTVDNTVVKYRAAEPVARAGIYKDIIATDIVHAYPFAVISNNIAPETKDPNGKYLTPNGIRYNNKHSVFIDTLKELMTDRGLIKEKLKKTDKESDEWATLKSIDFALKTQTAAFSHGIFGWGHSRMRDYDVADSITAVVRDLIDVIKSACDSINYRWCYAHTDSCYINAPNEKKDKILKYLNNIIEDKYKHAKGVPELEFKKFYKVGYIHSKARNVLVPEDVMVEDDENWDVTGMNFMRSEVPEKLRDIEIKCIKEKLQGYGEVYRLYQLQDMIKKLRNADSRELGLIKPLKKKREEYGRKILDGSIGGVPAHIKALDRAKREYGFNVNVGEKFMLLPILTNETVGKKKVRRKKVEIAYSIDDGLPDGYTIDYEYYLRGNLWGKINQLFDCTPRELEKKIMIPRVKNTLGVM